MLDRLTKYEKYILVFLFAGIMAGSLTNYIKKRIKSESAPSEFLAPDIIKVDKELKIVNINIAEKKDFEELPGIGPALSERIISYRNLHGQFKENEELMKVSGIGPKKFEKIKEFLMIE